MSEDASELGWRVISGENLLVMLRRVETGERPALVFEEFWADTSPVHVNSDDEHDV